MEVSLPIKITKFYPRKLPAIRYLIVDCVIYVYVINFLNQFSLPPQSRAWAGKDDVYSFGVLASCEVVNARFLEAAVFLRLLLSMEGVWRELHPLITSCVSHSPQDRPSMDTVLHHIKQLNSES